MNALQFFPWPEEVSIVVMGTIMIEGTLRSIIIEHDRVIE